MRIGISHFGIRRQKMKKFKIFLSFTISLLLPVVAFSAELTEPKMYTYATYFQCDVAQEKAVDEVVAKQYAPVYDAAVKDGTIEAWGWLVHQTGGQWRRILYHSSASIEGLFTAQDVMGVKLDKAFGKTPDALSTGCRSHDDYVWEHVAGSNLDDKNTPRGKASMSVYMVCDFANEERADEIVKTVFAPVYNEYVGKGKLTSWGWLSHVIGGEYRKLSTMSAENYGDLLKVRAEILEKIFYKGNKEIGEEFSEICGSHQDYLWTIKQQS